jgi:hypothetical protein
MYVCVRVCMYECIYVSVCKYVYINVDSVITAAFHSVGMKHRGLASSSENACTRKAASVVVLTRSGSRLLKLPFRKCCSFLCPLYCCYVLICNKSELVKNCQL